MYLSTLLALQGWVINFLYNKIIIIIKRKYICIHTCNVVGRRKEKAKNLVKDDETSPWAFCEYKGPMVL